MKYNTAFLQQLQHELDNGTLPGKLCYIHNIQPSVLSRLKKQGKLSFKNERPQKRDWIAFEQSFHEHGLERAMIIHDTTKCAVRTAINKDRLSNILNINKSSPKFKHYTKEELTEAVINSITMSDVCRALSVTICTFNFKRIKNLCLQYGIPCEFNFDRTNIDNKSYGYSYSDAFCENSMLNRSGLRDVLIRYNMYTGKCALCECSDIHNNQPLTLEVDHINGTSDDNRIENLRWLCPNCHSQTPTYRRRKSLR